MKLKHSKEQYGENFDMFLIVNKELTEEAFEKNIKSSLYQQKMIESIVTVKKKLMLNMKT